MCPNILQKENIYFQNLTRDQSHFLLQKKNLKFKCVFWLRSNEYTCSHVKLQSHYIAILLHSHISQNLVGSQRKTEIFGIMEMHCILVTISLQSRYDYGNAMAFLQQSCGD